MTLSEEAIAKYAPREARTFYDQDGKAVTGLWTQEPGCWWVPENHVSCWEGTHLFETAALAKEAKIGRLHKQRWLIESELKKLGSM